MANKDRKHAINEALAGREIDFRRLLDGLAEVMREEGLLTPLQRRAARLAAEIEVIGKQRFLLEKGEVHVGRHAEDFRALAQDGARCRKFYEGVESYRRAWGATERLERMTLAGSYPQDARRYLAGHPLVQTAPGGVVHAVPLAALFDLGNRSRLGLYHQDHSAVTALSDPQRTSFTTLCHLPYWRELMGRKALVVSERFERARHPFNLVMVGDGSGELGADMARALLREGKDFCLMHLDTSDAMLAAQRTRYRDAGVGRIVTIKGSVLEADQSIKAALPGFRGGFFVLHEVLDDLRTHALFVEHSRVRELYKILAQGAFQTTQAFEPTGKLLQDICDYLPYHRTNGPGRIHCISLEAAAAIRELLIYNDYAALYVGDYGGQYAIDAYAHGTEELPVRLYAPHLADEKDIDAILRHPCNVTADALPAMLHLAEAFGGRVEQLGTFEEFLCDVEPGLTDHLEGELQRIQHKARQGEYLDPVSLHEDALISQMAAPMLFAGFVTKNL